MFRVGCKTHTCDAHRVQGEHTALAGPCLHSQIVSPPQQGTPRSIEFNPRQNTKDYPTSACARLDVTVKQGRIYERWTRKGKFWQCRLEEVKKKRMNKDLWIRIHPLFFSPLTEHLLNKILAGQLMTNVIQSAGVCWSWDSRNCQTDSPTSLAQFRAVFIEKKERKKNPPSEVTVLLSPGTVSVSAFHTDSQSSYSAASEVPALSTGAAALCWQRRHFVEFFKRGLFHGVEKYFLLGILGQLALPKKEAKVPKRGNIWNFIFFIRGNIKFRSLLKC